MNVGLFVVGLIPTVTWTTACVWAIRNRLAIAATGFFLAAFNGVVIAFIGSGVEVPNWLAVASTLFRVPTVVTLTVGFVYAYHGVKFVDIVAWIVRRPAGHG